MASPGTGTVSIFRARDGRNQCPSCPRKAPVPALSVICRVHLHLHGPRSFLASKPSPPRVLSAASTEPLPGPVLRCPVRVYRRTCGSPTPPFLAPPSLFAGERTRGWTRAPTHPLVSWALGLSACPTRLKSLASEPPRRHSWPQEGLAGHFRGSSRDRRRRHWYPGLRT